MVLNRSGVLAVVVGALALGGTALAADAKGAKPATPAIPASVDAVVRANQAQVRSCYDAALLLNPELQGTLVFGWTITPSGTVGDGCVESSALSDKLGVKLDAVEEDKLSRCISHAVFSWKFPPSKDGKVVEVSYPFVLERAEVPAAGETKSH